MATNDPGKTGWVRLILLLCPVAGGALLIRVSGLQEYLRLEDAAKLRRWIQGLGPLGPLAFALAYGVAVVFFVPGLPITILGGIAFGPLWGTVYVSLASTLGAGMAFLIARYAARHTVERWLEGNPRLARIDEAVARHGWRIVMVTRLVPLFPFNLQNYAYGLTRMNFWTYLLTSWVCMLPATAAFTFAGGALSEGGGDTHRALTYLGIAGLLLVGVSLLPRWLGRRNRIPSELLSRK